MKLDIPGKIKKKWDALSFIVHADLYERGRKMCEKLKDEMPRVSSLKFRSRPQSEAKSLPERRLRLSAKIRCISRKRNGKKKL